MMRSGRCARSRPKRRIVSPGRRAIEVVDATYASGVAGFAGYGWYSFQNARIAGAPGTLAPWNRAQKIPVHHFTVGLDDSTMPSGCLAPIGDVLLAAGNLLVRSKDRGRTRESPVPCVPATSTSGAGAGAA